MSEAYTSARDLLDGVELVDVRFIECSGLLVQPREVDEEVLLQLATAPSADDLRFSFRALATQPDADLTVAVQLRYARREAAPTLADVDDDVSREFIEKVAMMSAYPFLREGLIGLASKLRVDPPVLSLLRAGEFKVEASVTDSGAEQQVSGKRKSTNLA